VCLYARNAVNEVVDPAGEALESNESQSG
jgi:hypothetical protein